jgi:hypothetical protein
VTVHDVLRLARMVNIATYFVWSVLIILLERQC